MYVVIDYQLVHLKANKFFTTFGLKPDSYKMSKKKKSQERTAFVTPDISWMFTKIKDAILSSKWCASCFQKIY